MTIEEGAVVLLCFGFFVAGLMAGNASGEHQECKRWREDLIKRGLGAWKVKPETGESWFEIAKKEGVGTR